MISYTSAPSFSQNLKALIHEGIVLGCFSSRKGGLLSIIVTIASEIIIRVKVEMKVVDKMLSE